MERLGYCLECLKYCHRPAKNIHPAHATASILEVLTNSLSYRINSLSTQRPIRVIDVRSDDRQGWRQLKLQLPEAVRRATTLLIEEAVEHLTWQVLLDELVDGFVIRVSFIAGDLHVEVY